jgi:hypothetical protein
MRAVDQWKRIETGLPDGWEEVRLSYTVEDPAAVAAAAAVLAPLGPGRSGSKLRFHVRPSGPAGAESVRNLLARLDRKRLLGDLALGEVQVPQEAWGLATRTASGEQPRARLVDAWDEQLETVPPDWSDLLCELQVDSSDYLPRAALLGAPFNPTRNLDALALRFRVSRKGYGVSPSMARRCFERMDEDGITGSLVVLNGLSQVDYVGTLGPVWRIAGRSV